MEGCIEKVLDTKGALRCVRFESGDVGVVDGHGKVIFQCGRFRHAEFAGHGFVKLRSSKAEVMRDPELRYMLRDGHCPCIHVFYADLKSGQLFGSMPELHRYGDFEVAFLCGYMFTRTKKCYCVETHPSFVRAARNGLYLVLPFNGSPEGEVLGKMIYRLRDHRRCQIKGDEAGTYWLMVEYSDESVVVMDDGGEYYYVRSDRKTGRAVWSELGNGGNVAERSLIHTGIEDIRVEVRTRMEQEREEAMKAAERQRRKEIRELTSVVPFRLGGKWGLKQDGRIVVPATYRTIQAPVGKYCAVEKYPGIWGVIAVDGKVEIEAKYEGVEIRPDGTVELTAFNGRTVVENLKFKI